MIVLFTSFSLNILLFVENEVSAVVFTMLEPEDLRRELRVSFGGRKIIQKLLSDVKYT